MKDEGERRRQQIENLIRENKGLDENLVQLQSNKRSLEMDLDALSKKHDYTMTDLNATVQKLENENFQLQKTREDLEHKIAVKNGEVSNVHADLKRGRNEVNSKEIQLHEQIARNEKELQKDREMYKHLANHSSAVKKQLEQLHKERQENDQILKQLHDKE